MFTAALFTTAEMWKQPKCPLTDVWISKMWSIRTREYYLALKRISDTCYNMDEPWGKLC